MTAESALSEDLRDLKEIARYWRTVPGIGTLAATISPAAALIDSPVFPGMTKLWVPILGPTLCLAFILFLFFRYRNHSARDISRAATVLFVVAVVLLVSYVVAWLTWVVPVNDQWHVIGVGLTSEALSAVDQGRVPNDTQALLDRFGHSSEARIWSGRTIVFATLIFSFAGFCATLASSFFLFTLQKLK